MRDAIPARTPIDDFEMHRRLNLEIVNPLERVLARERNPASNFFAAGFETGISA